VGGATDPKHPELGLQQAFYNEKDPTQLSYAGAAPEKAEKPETKEQHENRYAELRSVSQQRALTPDEQKEFGTLSTELSVGDTGAKGFNDRMADVEKQYDLKGANLDPYKVLPSDTDAEAKQKEAEFDKLTSGASTRADREANATSKAAEQTGKVYDNYAKQIDKD